MFQKNTFEVLNTGKQDLPHISHKQHVTKAIIQGNNNLTNLINLEHLPMLEMLQANNNNLQNIQTLRFLEYLVFIDISNNQLTNIDSLVSCKQVQYLNISHNKLYLKLDIDICSIKPIHTQNKLLISAQLKSSAQQSQLLNSQLSIQNRCQSSVMQNIPLNNLPMLFQVINSLNHLEYLDISSNQISKLILTNSVNKLTTLKASHNKLESIDFLKYMYNLQNLDLQNNNLSDVLEIKLLQSAPLLRTLQLHNNPFSLNPEREAILKLKIYSLNLTKLKQLNSKTDNVEEELQLIKQQLNENDKIEILRMKQKENIEKQKSQNNKYKKNNTTSIKTDSGFCEIDNDANPVQQKKCLISKKQQTQFNEQILQKSLQQGQIVHSPQLKQNNSQMEQHTQNDLIDNILQSDQQINNNSTDVVHQINLNDDNQQLIQKELEYDCQMKIKNLEQLKTNQKNSQDQNNTYDIQNNLDGEQYYYYDNNTDDPQIELSFKQCQAKDQNLNQQQTQQQQTFNQTQSSIFNNLQNTDLILQNGKQMKHLKKLMDDNVQLLQKNDKLINANYALNQQLKMKDFEILQQKQQLLKIIHLQNASQLNSVIDNKRKSLLNVDDQVLQMNDNGDFMINYNGQLLILNMNDFSFVNQEQEVEKVQQIKQKYNNVTQEDLVTKMTTLLSNQENIIQQKAPQCLQNVINSQIDQKKLVLKKYNELMKDCEMKEKQYQKSQQINQFVD